MKSKRHLVHRLVVVFSMSALVVAGVVGCDGGLPLDQQSGSFAQMELMEDESSAEPQSMAQAVDPAATAPVPLHEYSCKIDLFGMSDCKYFVRVLQHNKKLGQALLQMDLSSFEEASVTVHYWGAQGWITNLGNSRTNNGAGGDAGTNSFDSELDVRGHESRADLNVYTNDYYSPNRGSVFDLFKWTAKTEILRFVVRDGNLKVYRRPSSSIVQPPADNALEASQVEPLLQLVSEFNGEGYFQLDGWDHEAHAYNDRQLFIGLNRVIANNLRWGKGAVAASFVLRGFYPPPPTVDTP